MESRPKSLVSSKGKNLGKLHTACSKGDVRDVKSLLEQAKLGYKGQRLKDTASAAITPPGDREDVFFSGYLPIHTACQRQEGSREIIQVLLSGGGYALSDKTSNGELDTALHVACASGNKEAVSALLCFSERTGIRECLKHQNKEGNTPLHLASRDGSSEVAKLLLEQLMPVDSKQVLSKTNKLGETCISLAVNTRDWNLVNLLLIHSHANPATLYRDFVSHFPTCQLAENIQSFEHASTDVFLLGDPRSSKTTLISTFQYAAQSNLSKLVTVLPFIGSRTVVESYKSCIVPSTVGYRKQDHKCPFILHDVNGCRSYAQEAIFTCASNPLNALYIITVDARKNVKESVLYWLGFLEHQLSTYRHCVDESPIKTSRMKLKVALAITYCDLVLPHQYQAVKKMDLPSILSVSGDLISQFTWWGNYCINARKHNSLDMPQLLSTLQGHCQFNVESDQGKLGKNLLAQTYVLASLLLNENFGTSFPTFSDVMGLIQHTDNPLCKILPRKDEDIEALCRNLQLLNIKTLTFDTQNRRVNNWYIILDYKYLLKSVEGALDSLSPHSKNGIVTRHQIKTAFSIHTKFIISFLEHLKLCEFISSEGLESMRRSIRSSRRSKTSIKSKASIRSTLDALPSIVVRKHRRAASDSNILETDYVPADRDLALSSSVFMSSSQIPESPMQLEVGRLFSSRPPSRNPSPMSSRHSSRKSIASYQEVPCYFFPSLVPHTQPKGLWDEDSTEYTYGFSWSLVPHEEETWFLSPKFITIILFRLLFSFAPRPPNPRSVVDRLCKLWSRGILWSDPLGARVCVAISDDNKITLSMQCMRKYEVSCLSIRNEIMADIKQQLKEMHPTIVPRELFTPYNGVNVFPVIHPLESYVTFDKEEIRLAIMENRLVMCTEGKHPKPLDSLLHFEPLCFLSPPLLRDLFDEEKKDEVISDEFCLQLAMNLSTKWTLLAEHFMDTVIKKYYIDSLIEDATLKKAPYGTAMEMLMHLREVDAKDASDRVDTYSGFRRSLFEISIFTADELATYIAS